MRSRVLSLLSLDASTGPIRPESPKAEPTTWTSASFQNHFACGSFVPNTSATVALRTFLFPTVTHVRVRGRMRYNSHFEKKPDLPPSPSSPIPVITRALPLSSGSRSPSSNITSPTIPKVWRSHPVSEVHPSDLHPVLASLERRSKFCVKKDVCATCKRVGSGFPQCGKCGDSWCSRECRLDGGKKHICKG